MKTKLPLLLALATTLGVPLASAQDDRRPDAPRPPETPRTPDSPRPPEGARERRPDGERPVERPRRPEGDRPAGVPQEGARDRRPDGERRPDGDRPGNPPGDGQRRPEGDRPGGLRRPNAERGGEPQRPDGIRPPGQGQDGPRRPDGDRSPEGRRPDGDRPDGPRREGAPTDGVRGDNQRMRGERTFQIPLPRPQKPTAYLGVMTSPVPPPMASQLGLPEGFGLVVDEVVPQSPAANAGVQRFDVLKLLNDQQLIDPNQLATLVRSFGKNTDVSLTVLRKSQEQKLTLKIGERLLPERAMGAGRVDILRQNIPQFEPLRERTEDRVKELQERVRKFDGRMREYRERMDQWRKNPSSSAPPEPPTLEPLTADLAPVPQVGVLLRELRPGGAPAVKIISDGNMTTWNTASAHIFLKDESGEIEVRSDNGHRTVTAKNPAGETIFTGPIDTEEQRKAAPEAIREKLEKIEVQTKVAPSLPLGAEATASAGVPFTLPLPPLEPEIQ